LQKGKAKNIACNVAHFSVKIIHNLLNFQTEKRSVAIFKKTGLGGRNYAAQPILFNKILGLAHPAGRPAHAGV